MPDQHGGVVRLEACDAFWLAGLAHCVDGVAHADLGLNRLQLLVESDQHARVDRQCQVEQEIMVLSCDESLHISCGDQHGQQATEGDV